MKSGIPFETLVSASEKALDKLRRTYTKSGTERMVELEVSGDDPFTVRIQRLEPLPHYNPLLGGLVSGEGKEEVNVAIVLGDGGNAKEAASRFVGELIASLPTEPWKGLGFVESLTAKSLWRRWVAGLEDR